MVVCYLTITIYTVFYEVMNFIVIFSYRGCILSHSQYFISSVIFIPWAVSKVTKHCLCCTGVTETRTPVLGLTVCVTRSLYTCTLHTNYIIFQLTLKSMSSAKPNIRLMIFSNLRLSSFKMLLKWWFFKYLF